MSKSDDIWQAYANLIGLKPYPYYYKIDAITTDNFIQKLLGFNKNITFNDYTPYKKAYFVYKNELKITKKLINQITNPYKKVLAQIELVKAFPQKQEIDKTEDLIEQLPYREKSLAKSKLKKALFQIKESCKTGKKTNLISYYYIKKNFLEDSKLKSVYELAQAKEFDKAKEKANQIRCTWNKIYALIEIIKISPREKEFNEVKELIRTETDPLFERSKALIQLSHLFFQETQFKDFAQIKEFDKAKEVFNQITNHDCNTLAQIMFHCNQLKRVFGKEV